LINYHGILKVLIKKGLGLKAADWVGESEFYVLADLCAGE
jgi:hypothetical protein